MMKIYSRKIKKKIRLKKIKKFYKKKLKTFYSQIKKKFHKMIIKKLTLTNKINTNNFQLTINKMIHQKIKIFHWKKKIVLI